MRALRTPAVAALVALLVGGAGVATASKLLTGRNIKNGSLTGADIKNGSLSRTDLAKGVLPTQVQVPVAGTTTGATGAPGAPGAPGSPGANAFGHLSYRVAGPFDNGDGELSGGAAACPSGENAIGGGAFGDAEDPGQTITSSGPATSAGTLDPSRWQVWMSNRSGADSSFSVYVVCAAAGDVSTG